MVKEEKVPKVVDKRGYVLTQEEIRREMEIYKKAGISFLCPHCRGIVGTNDYKEFTRRRDTMWQKVPYSITRDGRLILGEKPTEDLEKVMKRHKELRKQLHKEFKRYDELFKRYEQHTLVECPKCQNRYDRFLLEECPMCGEPNPKFRDIWKTKE